MSPSEPQIKRAVAFVDGQNLFHAARKAFGHTYPNYDIRALCRAVCQGKGWDLVQPRFYTGVPNQSDDPFWNYFWTHKLAMLGRQGVHVYSRPLRYRNQVVRLPDGTEHSFLAGEEKGVVAGPCFKAEELPEVPEAGMKRLRKPPKVLKSGTVSFEGFE